MATHVNCQNLSRRDCLRLGLWGLAGVSMADLFRYRAVVAGSAGTGGSSDSLGSKGAAARSCILVWMDGGPSHYETFDPKPDAPSEIRGEYPAISTCVADVYFSQHCRKLAQMADKLAIVRSIRHNQGNHGAGNHYLMTGAPPRIPVGCGAFVSFHPSMGSVVSSQREAPDGLPAYFSLPRMSRSGGPNFLGARHAPFVVADDPARASFQVRDVVAPRGLAESRLSARTRLRDRLDRMPRFVEPSVGDPVAAGDEHYQQAMELVASPAARHALDIHREPDRVRDAYGRNGFGQRALLARRLIEAGVPFITLYEGGWDHHRTIFKDLDRKLPPFDATLAALIEDLDQRGMLSETLVIALGEFGRTPKINSRGGRDHWSNAMSVLLAGGGTPGGVVIGATDRNGYAAQERILSPENFVSTVYHKLGIDPGMVMHTSERRPIHLVSDPTPIAELCAENV